MHAPISKLTRNKLDWPQLHSGFDITFTETRTKRLMIGESHGTIFWVDRDLTGTLTTFLRDLEFSNHHFNGCDRICALERGIDGKEYGEIEYHPRFFVDRDL